LPTGQDQVVFADLLDGSGQGGGRCCAVGVDQLRVIDVHGCVGAHRDSPFEGVAGC
jgi:hypothetical protein